MLTNLLNMIIYKLIITLGIIYTYIKFVLKWTHLCVLIYLFMNRVAFFFIIDHAKYGFTVLGFKVILLIIYDCSIIICLKLK